MAALRTSRIPAPDSTAAAAPFRAWRECRCETPSSNKWYRPLQSHQQSQTLSCEQYPPAYCHACWQKTQAQLTHEYTIPRNQFRDTHKSGDSRTP